VPPESPTLGLTHLQFEAPLTALRDSPAGTPVRIGMCCRSSMYTFSQETRPCSPPAVQS
jgi:hypothetical protein